MRYRTAIFDLDGTITDSGQGIMNAIRYAVKKHALPEISEETLRSFIGPPLKEQFQSVFGLSENEGADMVATYREYYSDKGIFENRVYDGVPEMLEGLKTAGARILMATSKPEKYAKKGLYGQEYSIRQGWYHTCDTTFVGRGEGGITRMIPLAPARTPIGIHPDIDE